MGRRQVAGVVAATALALVPAVPSGAAVPAGAGTGSSERAAVAVEPITRQAPTRIRKQVRKRTNRIRSNRDLARLRKNKCVNGFAQRWAKKMARKGSLEHQDLGPIMQRCNLSWVGENIAYGYPSAKAVMKGWMNSPGHRANILRREYRLLGVGVHRKNGTLWYSQVFGRR